MKLILFLGALFVAGAIANDLPSADMVVVSKTERKLYLMRDGYSFREYSIALGDQPVGHKEREGDERTPEGSYLLDWRNPESRFYKSIHISYPNAADEKRARELGADPGGMIMIHGEVEAPVLRRLNKLRNDWTDGCIAVSNAETEEIWHSVSDGTPIEILP